MAPNFKCPDSRSSRGSRLWQGGVGVGGGWRTAGGPPEDVVLVTSKGIKTQMAIRLCSGVGVPSWRC